MNEIGGRDAPAPMVLAVPDPHIERWLLLDGVAFKAVFGRGCDAPDMKCSRDKYKRNLIKSIRNTGVIPNLGKIKYADNYRATGEHRPRHEGRPIHFALR